MPTESGISREYNTKILLFSSRDIRYKTPFGAVSASQKMTVTFPVRSDFRAEKVFIILRLHEKTRRMALEKTDALGNYDIFSITFSAGEAGTYYYRFEIEKNGLLHFAGRDFGGEAALRDWMPEWQLSVYSDGYLIPKIQEGGVIYQIFCDRFCNLNNQQKPLFGVLKGWDEDITIVDSDGVYRANDFYGGNLKGIESKLPYLAELGVTMLYLSPVFESHSNHRYDTGDYTAIDAVLGTEEDFSSLIKQAKKKGISVMLDGVFNHTGADSVYFNKFNHYPSLGAYQSKESPYYDWFTFTDFPDLYQCWWGVTVVPTVSRHSSEFQDFIAGDGGVIDKWTKHGVKGWRIDVVDELSTPFVEKLRSAVKRNDKDALLVGEVWEDASTKYSYGEERSYFRGKELDGVMNYVFKDAIIAYLKDCDAAAFVEKVMTVCENYPLHALLNSMTLLDSHDTCRIINLLADVDVSNTSKQYRKDYRLTDAEYGKGKSRLFLATCLQYFLPGLPTVYYGDEIGMQGFEDPINRRPFGFGGMDEEILAHYKKLGALRKKYRKSFTKIGKMQVFDGIFMLELAELTLFANPTEESIKLENEVVDCLTGKRVSEVFPMSAVIYTN